jgi:hypothetical protein
MRQPLVGWGIWVLLSASSHALSADRKPMGREALVSVLAYYRDIRSLKTHFQETKTLKDMKSPLLSEGNLTITRPDRVVWEVIKPSRTLVELDRQGIRIKSGEGKDQKEETFGFAEKGGEKVTEGLAQLVAWLRLDPELLLNAYEIFSLGQDEYEFFPKNPSLSPFAKIQMQLKSKSHLERLRILEKSGDSIEIRFDPPKIVRSK